MAICDPTQPLPALPNTAPIQSVTSAMQSWAASIANNGAIPIGSVFYQTFGAIPVVARVECHSYTTVVVSGQTTNVPGAYHGVTLYRDTLPVGSRSALRTVSWGSIGLAGLGAVVLVGAIWHVKKYG